MEQLQTELFEKLASMDNEGEIQGYLAELVSLYPFNEYEYIIAHLLVGNKLSLEEYYTLRDEYIKRNLYLYLFEISSPRGFGELWAQGHLKELLPELQRPNRTIDPDYTGQYDFYLEPSIRIEVKASRAVEAYKDAPLYVKALSSDSKKQFDMNFQQIKPACCDVFVWLGVWSDVIHHWVIPSYEVEHHEYYSKGQHRGNIGEGQLHINRDNIQYFTHYLVGSRDIEIAIRQAFVRETLYRDTSHT